MPGRHNSPDQHRIRRRFGGATLVFGVLAVAILATGCSSSSESTDPTAEEAARTVVGGFGLPSGELDCLEKAFADEPAGRQAMGIGGGASAEQRDRLRAVLETCITPLELGTVLAAATAAAIPGTDESTEACLRSAIENFDDATRALFLVGFVLSGDGAVDGLDQDLGTKTDELFATCAVNSPGTGVTEPPAASSEPTTPTASTP